MFEQKQFYNVDDLVKVIAALREPNGCPWDREQNHHSIRMNFIEEVYEAIEAIDNEDRELLREELGDVLLQVVFHAQMEHEVGGFSFNDVCNDVCQKMIRRHPHVFGDVVANDSDEALSSWEAAKCKEKGQQNAASTLSSVSRSLPALMRAEKVGGRAAKAGFDYDHASEALDDLKIEVTELEEALAGGDISAIEDELGDVFFAAVNVARLNKLNPELVLTHAVDKFSQRFAIVEQLANERGIDMKSAGMNELNSLWKEAKNK